MKKNKNLRLLTLTFLASLSFGSSGQAVYCPNHITRGQMLQINAGTPVEINGIWLSVGGSVWNPDILPHDGLRAPPGGLEGQPEPRRGDGAYGCIYRFGPGRTFAVIARTPAAQVEYARMRAAAEAARQHALHIMPGQHGQHSMPAQHGHHSVPVQPPHHAMPVQHAHHTMPVQHALHSMPVQHGHHSMPGQNDHHSR